MAITLDWQIFPSFKNKIKQYYAHFPIFEQESEKIAEIVSSLAYPLTDTMKAQFDDVFQAAKSFIVDGKEMQERIEWLSAIINKPELISYGIKPDLWLLANLAEAGEILLRNTNNDDNKQKLQNWGWNGFLN